VAKKQRDDRDKKDSGMIERTVKIKRCAAVVKGGRRFSLVDGALPHRVDGRYGAARVVLLPAGPGTGIIAGSAVRAVCEAAGVKNILTKSFGSNNPVTLVKATIDALQSVRTKEDVQRLRGVEL